MNLRVFGRQGKLTPCNGESIPGGYMAFGLLNGDGSPKEIRCSAVAVQVADGIDMVRVVVQERWAQYGKPESGPGEVFIDEMLRATDDDFAKLIMGQSFTVSLGLGNKPFDVEEMLITVWADGGKAEKPANAPEGQEYADVGVVMDLNFAPTGASAPKV